MKDGAERVFHGDFTFLIVDELRHTPRFSFIHFKVSSVCEEVPQPPTNTFNCEEISLHSWSLCTHLEVVQRWDLYTSSEFCCWRNSIVVNDFYTGCCWSRGCTNAQVWSDTQFLSLFTIWWGLNAGWFYDQRAILYTQVYVFCIPPILYVVNCNSFWRKFHNSKNV